VPEKEGNIKPYRDIEQIARDRKEVILLDNNVLACDHGLKQVEKITELPIRVDFNQGLDARLITPEIAKLLSKVKWIRFIRMACDNLSMIYDVDTAVTFLTDNGIKPRQIFVYVLAKEVETTLTRIRELRKIGVDIFVQAYRDKEGNKPKRILRELERWVNVRPMFKTHTFEQSIELRMGK